MKRLFVATAVLTLALGVGWLFFPQAMLASWGVAGDPLAVYMSRRYGGLFFGYAVLLWLARSAGPSPARRAILAGGAVVTVLMTVVSLVGALTGVVGPMIWSVVAIEVLLSGAFVYSFATAPDPPGVERG